MSPGLNSRTLPTESPEDSLSVVRQQIVIVWGTACTWVGATGSQIKTACLRARCGEWSLVAIFKMHVNSRKTCFQVILNDHPPIPNVLLMVLGKDVLILCKRKMNQIISKDYSPSFGLARVREASERHAP